MSTEYVFQIEDWRGRTVRLTRRTFDSHALKRPEFPEYLPEAQETIRDPDIVQEGDNRAILLYRFGIGRPPFSRLYLMVVVFYRQRMGRESGVVATHFFTDMLAPNSPIIEHRAQVIGGQRFPLAERGGPDHGR